MPSPRSTFLALLLIGVGWLSSVLQAEEKFTVEQLAKNARQSIVVISISGRDGGQQGMGTGFVIDKTGLIATNLHVIGEARPIKIQTADGKSLQVTAIHATDRARDLAILRVAEKDLAALPLGDSDKLEQGQPIVLLGNPQGLKHSVVAGVVSGTREVEDRTLIQLAVPVEPGNSGGPVLDMQGRVQGVMTMKSAVTENLGFAVSANDLQPLLDKPNPVPIERWLTIGTLDNKEWTTLFGSLWQQRGGRILVSGLGQGFGGRSLCLASATPPELPYEVAVSVLLDDEAGAAGLVFHADGGDRHYGFYPSNGKLRLSRFEGADVFSWKVLLEKPIDSYKPGEWNRLRVRIEKDKFRCYVNDELVIESTDDAFTKGKVGLAKFRQTAAQFRRFEVARETVSKQADEKLALELNAAIERLPQLAEVKAEQLSPLEKQAGLSSDLLRQRAKELDQRATDLRRLAADVRAASVCQQLAKVAGPEVKEVNLVRGALLVATLDEEDIDIEAYVRQLDRIAGEVRASLKKDASDADKLAALNKLLFDELGFHGSRSDYYNAANSYLNRVLDDREGLPITLSLVYMELARRLDLKVVGVGLPGHFVVRHEPTKGDKQLLDVFDGGKPLSDKEAAKIVLDNTGEPIQPQHLKTVTERQMLLRMLQNLLGVAQGKKDREATLRYLQALITLEPELPRERGLQAMLRFETGRKQAAITGLDWFLQTKPEGIDLEQIEKMQQFFRDNKAERIVP
ncbi:transglutaminase family protein [Anatilimnocola floriformis]|uniref:transglutaminase family protein n=1 Tax=Anatilimnocola floriformis TaxID=2948575 RepID=UPI0020C42F61|nr:tetratricopeptide repeat protein [Anatilimnocola floriformis]